MLRLCLPLRCSPKVTLRPLDGWRMDGGMALTSMAGGTSLPPSQQQCQCHLPDTGSPWMQPPLPRLRLLFLASVLGKKYIHSPFLSLQPAGSRLGNRSIGNKLYVYTYLYKLFIYLFI